MSYTIGFVLGFIVGFVFKCKKQDNCNISLFQIGDTKQENKR